MKLIKLTIFCLTLICSQSLMAQKSTWGAGLRFGDPTGISIKKYGAKAAVEFNMGRTYNLYYHNYEKDFYRYDQYDNRGIYVYDKYTVQAPIAVQLHIMKQKKIKDIKGMDWYIGAGPQFRSQRLEYFYKEKYGPDKNDWRYTSAVHRNIDLGVDGVIGLEYSFADMPLSIAADATIFMEIFDDPFIPWGQMGVALRYNF
jgi:hypothetical protein